MFLFSGFGVEGRWLGMVFFHGRWRERGQMEVVCDFDFECV